MSELLLSYYGDDLTGSTDAMEALTLAGLRSALFLQPATPALRARLEADGPLQALGLAGTSRSESPAWMDAHLPGALTWLRDQGAALCHYKVCSTFDSAPTVGSIGRALEIGRRIFEQASVPVVVGVPQLKRYTIFGQHFATLAGQTWRLDRHPVMSRHPVTPMDEADLARHLGRQTTLPVGNLHWHGLQADDADAQVDAALAATPGAVVFDVPDLETQARVGAQLWRLANSHPSQNGTFVVGSSGVEYALVPRWRALGLVAATASATVPPEGPVDRLAVVSGSCSAVTAAQIEHAVAHAGFVAVPTDAARLASRSQRAAEFERVHALACAALDQGRSVIVHAALGPDSVVSALPADAESHAISQSLGRLLRTLIEHAGLRRAVVAGGDTSSHALRELGVAALTVARALPATPGSPLCRAYSEDPRFDGLTLAFKGGQIGAPDYFETIRRGGETA